MAWREIEKNIKTHAPFLYLYYLKNGLHYQFTKYAQKGHIVNFCFVFVMFVVSIVGKIWRTEQCLT